MCSLKKALDSKEIKVLKQELKEYCLLKQSIWENHELYNSEEIEEMIESINNIKNIIKNKILELEKIS